METVRCSLGGTHSLKFDIYHNFYTFACCINLIPMIDLTEFESISPYSDAEAAEALSKLADYPLVMQVSQ